MTDTIPLSQAARGCSKIRQLSVAELLAETIRRIAIGETVSSLYVDKSAHQVPELTWSRVSSIVAARRFNAAK